MRTLILSLALALPGSAFAGTAWVSSNHIQVIDTDSGRVVGRIPLQEFIHDMEFSPDGGRVFVASSHGLRVADAKELTFGDKIADGGVLALSVAGERLVTLTKAGDEESLAARKSGEPVPASTVTVYETTGMTVTASWPVSGGTRDVLMSPDGSAVYALHPADGLVRSFGADGAERGSIDVAPVPRNERGDVEAIFSAMEMAPDGSHLVLPVTSESISALVDLDLSGAREQQVVVQDLGHRRRIQGVSWDEDGSGVYVTAVNHVVKFNAVGQPVNWRAMPINYVDIAPLTGTNTTVMVAPTFSSSRRSGGVSIIDDNGEVIRSVELPDMSPFHVAVAPTPAS